MLEWLRNLIYGKPETKPEVVVSPTPVVEPQITDAVTVKPKRAKNKKGKFVADDPATPENEAWVDGKAPVRKRTYTKKKVK